MRCQEIKIKLAHYLDGELSDQERAEIEQHLSACSACTRELEILVSIDAAGKVETFSEPAPKYWNQLRRNIMQQISEHEQNPSWIFSVLARFKRWLWPGKISYRLVGLAATAAIVFFVVRISIMRNGKFETPTEISRKDSTEILASKKHIIPDQPLIESKEKIPETKGKTKTATPTREKGVDFLEAQQPTAEIPSPAISDENQVFATSTEAAAISTEKGNGTRQSSVLVMNETDQKGQEPLHDQARSRTIADQATFEKAQFQFSAVSEKSRQQAFDSSFYKYNQISQQAQAISDLSEKIAIWEKFLQMKPKKKLAYQATHELALLYFQLVTEAPTSENVALAFAFYAENASILFSAPDSIKFKEQFKTLQSLEQK